MTIAFATSVSAGSAGSGTVTTNAVNTTGASLLVLQVNSFPGSHTLTVSDSLGNSWTQLNTYGNSGFQELSTFYCAAPTVGSAHTFTASYNNTGERPSITVLAFSGTASSPFDQQNGGAITSGTSIQPGSVTPSQSGEVLISGWGGYSQNSTPTIDSSFTIQEHVARTATAEPISSAYLIQTSATAENPTWSWSASDRAAANIVTFEAASGGTPTNVDPGAGSVIFTGEVPTVAAGTVINPGAGSIVFTGAAPSLVWDNALMPGAGSVRFNGQQPTVTGGTPSVTNIQLIAKRGHQTPGQPLGFV